MRKQFLPTRFISESTGILVNKASTFLIILELDILANYFSTPITE